MATPLAELVAARRPTWQALEDLLARHRRGPLSLAEVDELDRLYRRCAADLARARVHYPHTEVFTHLNQLVGRAYGAIYGAPRPRWPALRRFYAESFPRAFYQERRFFLAALLVLAASTWIGASVAVCHPEAAAALVPSGVREHIARGTMWTDSLLEAIPPALLSAKILTNNLGVAFIAFAGGLAFGLGTLLVLFANGLELGAVAALCVERGMARGFFAFVLAHAVLELSLIAIAGQAGLVLGWALVAPGERARVEALRARGRTAGRLVLGAAPILFFTGMVEGFVSPGDLFPGPVRGALGLALGALLYAYLIRFGRGSAG